VLSYCVLAGADFTGAIINGANFAYSGLTAQQLYSTASYQDRDLTGVRLTSDLSGGNLAGQNLTNADLTGTKLTGADFTGATIRGAKFDSSPNRPLLTAQQLYSTASYQAHDLRGVSMPWTDLTGGNLAGQDLTGANLAGCTLSGADLTGAIVKGATLSANGTFTAEQLYSTASYRSRDLAGIRLSGSLSGWNLAGQSLVNANLQAYLAATDFSSADLRGTTMRGTGFSDVPDETNTIFGNGLIAGLRLDAANPRLTVRDYDGTKPIPIHIGVTMTEDPGTTLQVLFQDATWGSTISFDPGIPVSIHGDLELGLAGGVDPAGLAGTSFQVFDWTGVTPEGQFNLRSDLPAGYGWDASGLYTTGNVTLTAVPEPAALVLAALGALLVLLRRGLRLR
jgi:uncharacterized protein YjbI with pentapeptide repeats